MFSIIGGLFLVGIVIKLMDDFLDQELDILTTNKNLAVKLGRGILPYTLLLLIFALYLNFNESLTLFTASYIIGMGYDTNQKLPSYLYAWQEGIIVFIITILITSFYETISALTLIVLLQLGDDLFDYRKDKNIGDNNFINKIGFIPTIIMIMILLLLAIKYFPLKLIYFLTAAALVYITTDIFCKSVDFE